MNANIDYLGMLNLLRHLLNKGVISRKEYDKIAARLAAQSGADIIVLT
ncbi:MAG: hypothetical protein PHO69_03135 [Petrimonas sp.]|nr:hypothetical protein [Petrimonas sp.]